MNPEPGLPPLRLDWQEGQAYATLELLLGLRSGRGGRRAVHLGPVSLALRSAAERALASAVWRTLLFDGEGWRERDLLREGRRTRGALWDAALNEGVQLRFSGASFRLWLALAGTTPERASRDVAAPRRLGLGEALPEGRTEAGDELFFLLAARNAADLELAAGDLDALERGLARVSGFAALVCPQVCLSEQVLDALFDALLADPTRARAVECLGPVLLAAWREVFDKLYPLHSKEARVLLPRARGLGRVWGRWLAALERAQRLDLAEPVLLVLADLAEHRLARSGEALRRDAAAVPGLVTLADRQQLLDAFRSFVDVHAFAFALRDRLGQERYGDDRYEESQRYLALVRDLLAPHRETLASLSRGLGSTVG